jgi:hypothetical protein
MAEKVVVEFITWTVFEYKPDQFFCHYNLIKTGDMWVEKLAMVMNLARQVRVLPWGGLEHNLWTNPIRIALPLISVVGWMIPWSHW